MNELAKVQHGNTEFKTEFSRLCLLLWTLVQYTFTGKSIHIRLSLVTHRGSSQRYCTCYMKATHLYNLNLYYNHALTYTTRRPKASWNKLNCPSYGRQQAPMLSVSNKLSIHASIHWHMTLQYTKQVNMCYVSYQPWTYSLYFHCTWTLMNYLSVNIWANSSTAYIFSWHKTACNVTAMHSTECTNIDTKDSVTDL